MNGMNEVLERDEKMTATPARAAGSGNLKSTRVWLVDDNANFRSLLADLLGAEMELDCEREFSSPPEVLAALSRGEAPDIILLDIEMGAHNGLDAIAPIKAVAPQTHVLMLTTFSGPGGRERAFRQGASDFMLKSWPSEKIAEHIRQAMEFGAVAGLMTAFLTGEGPVPKIAPAKTAAPKVLEMTVRTSWVERWSAHLRGFLRLSPSKAA